MKSNPNYLHLKRRVPHDRITLLQGGTRSGKTFAVIYWIIWLCRESEGAGIEIDIVRSTFTALRSTVMKDFFEVLMEHGLYSAKLHNKTHHVYQLMGNTISFYGCDDGEKVHGRKRDILWCNEINQFEEDTINQLFPRTKYRVIGDYNPALEVDHFLDPMIDKYPPCITTYRDNPHLTKDQVLDIEARKGNAYWWSVYGNGKRTAPIGAIFTKWSIGEFPEDLPFIYGQDYGWSNDASTLIKVAVSESAKKIYLHEELYETGLSTFQLANINKGVCGESLIIADGSEPRLIDELAVLGCNIERAEKGQGSVNAGIMKMMDYELIITSDSPNIKKEVINYKWADTKNKTAPIDKWNHTIDAARYGFTRLSGGIGNYVWGG